MAWKSYLSKSESMAWKFYLSKSKSMAWKFYLSKSIYWKKNTFSRKVFLKQNINSLTNMTTNMYDKSKYQIIYNRKLQPWVNMCTQPLVGGAWGQVNSCQSHAHAKSTSHTLQRIDGMVRNSVLCNLFFTSSIKQKVTK